MSMIHRAFVFDDDAFRSELAGMLGEALLSGDLTQLRAFIEQHHRKLTDPYEGEPLDASWESQIESKDAHQYGDFAITKYLDSAEDLGLGADWQAMGEFLEAHGLPESILLGAPFEGFDPGKQGSYFQSPQMVRDNLRRLDELVGRTPALARRVAPLRAMLEAAERRVRGLYVTF
jgi:hypothetical protein